MLQPENGQHMEYAGNVTQENNNRIMLPLHAYLAGGKLYGYSFCEKPIFPYYKGIGFNLTIMEVETSFEKVHPNSMIPIKSN